MRYHSLGPPVSHPCSCCQTDLFSCLVNWCAGADQGGSQHPPGALKGGVRGQGARGRRRRQVQAGGGRVPQGQLEPVGRGHCTWYHGLLWMADVSSEANQARANPQSSPWHDFRYRRDASKSVVSFSPQTVRLGRHNTVRAHCEGPSIIMHHNAFRHRRAKQGFREVCQRSLPTWRNAVGLLPWKQRAK